MAVHVPLLEGRAQRSSSPPLTRLASIAKGLYSSGRGAPLAAAADASSNCTTATAAAPRKQSCASHRPRPADERAPLPQARAGTATGKRCDEGEHQQRAAERTMCHPGLGPHVAVRARQHRIARHRHHAGHRRSGQHGGQRHHAPVPAAHAPAVDPVQVRPSRHHRTNTAVWTGSQCHTWPYIASSRPTACRDPIPAVSSSQALRAYARARRPPALPAAQGVERRPGERQHPGVGGNHQRGVEQHQGFIRCVHALRGRLCQPVGGRCGEGSQPLGRPRHRRRRSQPPPSDARCPVRRGRHSPPGSRSRPAAAWCLHRRPTGWRSSGAAAALCCCTARRSAARNGRLRSASPGRACNPAAPPTGRAHSRAPSICTPHTPQRRCGGEDERPSSARHAKAMVAAATSIQTARSRRGALTSSMPPPAALRGSSMWPVAQCAPGRPQAGGERAHRGGIRPAQTRSSTDLTMRTLASLRAVGARARRS